MRPTAIDWTVAVRAAVWYASMNCDRVVRERETESSRPYIDA